VKLAVEAHGDTPEVLDAAESALDNAAQPVRLFIAAVLVLSHLVRRDNGFRLAALQEAAYGVGVICFISEKLQRGRQACDDFFRDEVVVNIRRR
jgi:hypothetical protein